MGQGKKQVEVSNEFTTVAHIYSDKRKEEKRKLIEQEEEFVCNNLCCAYRTDDGTNSYEDEK